MPSLSDLKRSWFLRQLGLSTSTASEADLAAQVYSGNYSSNMVDTIALGPGELQPIVGSPVFSTINRTSVVDFDSTIAEIMGTQVFIPEHWGTFQATVYWANRAAAAGDVVWRLDIGVNTPGLAVLDPSPGTTIVANTPINTNLIIANSFPVASAVKGLCTIEIVRLATDAADTLPHDAAFLALVLKRISNA